MNVHKHPLDKEIDRLETLLANHPSMVELSRTQERNIKFSIEKLVELEGLIIALFNAGLNESEIDWLNIVYNVLGNMDLFANDGAQYLYTLINLTEDVTHMVQSRTGYVTEEEEQDIQPNRKLKIMRIEENDPDDPSKKEYRYIINGIEYEDLYNVASILDLDSTWDDQLDYDHDSTHYSFVVIEEIKAEPFRDGETRAYYKINGKLYYGNFYLARMLKKKESLWTKVGTKENRKVKITRVKDYQLSGPDGDFYRYLVNGVFYKDPYYVVSLFSLDSTWDSDVTMHSDIYGTAQSVIVEEISEGPYIYYKMHGVIYGSEWDLPALLSIDATWESDISEPNVESEKEVIEIERLKGSPYSYRTSKYYYKMKNHLFQSSWDIPPVLERDSTWEHWE